MTQETLYLNRDGERLGYKSRVGREPGILFLGGFRSNMEGTKALTLDEWANRTGHAFRRFDYSSQGCSSGDFLTGGSISRWRDDALAMLDATTGPQILVGSSMGGWIGLMLARLRPERLAGLLLLAPAPDFTEDLLWARLPDTAKKEIMENGVWFQPNVYEPEPRPITRLLIEDGRRNLVLDKPLKLNCPVRILQGMKDEDVPWQHAMKLIDLIDGNVRMTLIKHGEHRLSTPEDLLLTTQTLEAMVAG